MNTQTHSTEHDLTQPQLRKTWLRSTDGTDFRDNTKQVASPIRAIRVIRRLFLCALLLGALSAARADTLTVTTLDDSGPGSLRQSIADAAPGETIEFDSGVTGIITLTNGQLVINKDLTISGPGPTNLTISGNNASRVLRITAGVVHISGLTVANGRAANASIGYTGGGILLSDASLTISNCAILNNSVEGGGGNLSTGGGIHSAYSTLVVQDSRISNNAAGYGAGGISHFYPIGPLVIINTTIDGNHGLHRGGIQAYQTVLMTNVTISGNYRGLSGPGGGLMADHGDISSSTILDDISVGLLHVRNTILAGSSTAAMLNSLDYNLIRNTNDCTITNLTTHNIYGQDPLLGPLADNGGPTPTHALLPGSPAIDHGSSGGLATDQRGLPRPFNFPACYDADDASDIGAVEMQEGPQPGPVFTVNTTDDADDGLAGIAHCSLREAIAAANANPDTNTIDFAAEVPGLHSGVTGTITLTNGELTIANSANIDGPGAATLTVSGNNASRVFNLGAGISRISGLTIANGVCASGRGGGIVAGVFASLSISKCAICNNSTGNHGHGGGVYSAGNLAIEDTRIFSNSADGPGGGVGTFGSLVLVNSTISGNGVGPHGDGGGLFVGTLSMTNSTVTGNWSYYGDNDKAAGIYMSSGDISSSSIISNVVGIGIAIAGSASLQNTIVAGNVAADCSGIINSLDYNLIQNTNGCTITGLTDHNIYNQDPKLGPLADLGGPAPTHALWFDSPALDAGNSGGLATDQRGLPRPVDDPDIANAEGGDGSDIGAYEADPNLRITSIAKAGDDIRLQFSSMLGRNYRIESEDVITGPWTTLSNNIPGTGGAITVVDTGAANLPQRFYRAVLLLP